MDTLHQTFFQWMLAERLVAEENVKEAIRHITDVGTALMHGRVMAPGRV